MAKDRRCLDDQSWEVAAMASAETVMAVYSDREDQVLESRMRSKDSCPVWGEGAGKVPDGNSPTPYSTACTVRREALGRPRQRRSAPTLRDRPRAPGGASAPSRARPARAGSPHTEDQNCSWPINRTRPHVDVRVFAPEMLVRPSVPRVQG